MQFYKIWVHSFFYKIWVHSFFYKIWLHSFFYKIWLYSFFYKIWVHSFFIQVPFCETQISVLSFKSLKTDKGNDTGRGDADRESLDVSGSGKLSAPIVLFTFMRVIPRN